VDNVVKTKLLQKMGVLVLSEHKEFSFL